jgi:hypothetical protein
MVINTVHISKQESRLSDLSVPCSSASGVSLGSIVSALSKLWTRAA